MNDKERIVLWMGLILVGLNLVANWAQIKAIIFSGAGSVPTLPNLWPTGIDPAVSGVQNRVGSSPAAQQRTAAGQPPGSVAGRL